MQIHELNDFEGSLDAAFFAVDDGTDTGKVKKDRILNEINDELDALSSRIDNIITSPAPSAQEVTDGRLGEDGVTYGSLGEAIRTQIKKTNKNAKSSGESAGKSVYEDYSVLTGKEIINNNATYIEDAFLSADPSQIGRDLTNVTQVPYASAIYKRVDVAGYDHVVFPINKTSQEWGSLIVDEDDVVVQTILNTTLDSGSLIDVEIDPRGKTLIMLMFAGSANFVTDLVFITRYKYLNGESTKNDAEKSVLELTHLFGTNADLLTRRDIGQMTPYLRGYQLNTIGAIGNTVSSKKVINSDHTVFKIDVTGYEKIVVPCYVSSGGYGYLFADEDEIVVGVYSDDGSEHPARTMITLDVPEGATDFYISIYKTWWTVFDFRILKVISQGSGGGGSSIIIVHDDSYPSLSDAEKQAIVDLCSDYYAINNVFRYGGYYRNNFADWSCITSGKFNINCGVFAQFIWMGREAADFDPSNYSPNITKAFNWGYYFDFAIHKAVYKVAKSQSGTDAQRYYGYQQPSGSAPYAFNAYTQNGAMTWRWFMEAAALAEELYNMGCEVPRRAAEVGDMIFYRGAEYSGMTLESQLNFRNITHVGIIVDIDYQNSGRMRVAEVTNLNDLGETVDYMSLKESNTYNKVKAGYFESRICMIARHPHAFGIPSNVPNAVTAI